MPDGSPAHYASLNFANKTVLNAFLTSSGTLKLTVDMDKPWLLKISTIL